MVGEKTADSTHNFATDGLKLRVDAEGWISATDTTLGGDDGIAVAMMLAILDNPPEPHPAIECLFTVSEETGLEGAWAFDPAAAGATAHTMINLDSEAEGVLTAGCSGGMRTDITLPVTCEPAEGIAVKITLDGFTGGHSGVEIHEGHTNAIKAMGRILRALTEPYDFSLISVSGGGKDNAIPRDCTVTVDLRDTAHTEEFLRDVTAEAEKLRGEPNMIPADKSFTCIARVLTETPALCMDDKTTHAVLSLLTLVRDGVLSMSAHVEGLVAHSRNLGIVKTITDGEGKPTAVKFSMSTRSASNNHLDDSERELSALAAVLGGETTHRARYPGWDYAPVSPLRDLWTRVSEELYGVTPRIEVIHAGLECGILCDKLGEMDIISVGPDMKDIHTPREMLSIPSVERTYALVLKTLTELA
jgi:dipeptidase D